MALVRLRAFGPPADVGEPLLMGFAQNRYVAPMLLGEPWEQLDGFHGTGMAEPEWADGVVEAQARLWQTVPRGADVLRFWWAAPAVATWQKKLDETMVKLETLPASDERSALVTESFELRSEQIIRGLVQTVLSASGGRRVPRGRQAAALSAMQRRDARGRAGGP